MIVLIDFFGQEKDLNSLQMSCRGIIVFLFTLLLIRISGRRSFGVRTSLDNIIVILLGTILGRAVAGVSPFLPVVITSLVIVVLHRLFGWVIANSSRFSRFVEGNKIILFENGNFIEKSMDKALVCKEDVLQGVRKSAPTEDLNTIEKIYIERNGEVSAIKK